MSRHNFQTQHLKGAQKQMADSYYNSIKKQNEQKDSKFKKSIDKAESNKVESTEAKDTYETLMNKVIEESGLTLEEFMNQNHEIIREALFNNKGLSEEDIAFIEKRLAEDNTK